MIRAEETTRSGEAVAKIKSFVYETGQRAEEAVEVSPYFSTIHIDSRVDYFFKKAGRFDGTSCQTGGSDV